MQSIREEARDIPVIEEADICVLGGSCTGVFAAVRAARLGARVAIVEKQNKFGGVATAGLVNVWHSLYDTRFEKPIIAGLTLETIERLKRRDAVRQIEKNSHFGAVFNSEELAIELDGLVCESRVAPHLHTVFAAPLLRDGSLTAVAVENKSGRGAIRARVFIDATGDGDLCHRLGLPGSVNERLQPPTTCAHFTGLSSLGSVYLPDEVGKKGPAYGLAEGFGWGVPVPGDDVFMLAGTRVSGRNCADAADLTAAEIEGRRQVRAIMNLIRGEFPDSKVTLQALGAAIGIRETRHIHCAYRLTEEDVLTGRRFDDAIANGSYRVDVHHQEKPGITFKYLDGSQVYIRPGHPKEEGRWREKTETDPTFYQIPYRSLVPGTHDNLLLAGRMLDTDMGAFGAARVMVNLNQTGEAAGVAAWQALSSCVPVGDVAVEDIRRQLRAGGSIVI